MGFLEEQTVNLGWPGHLAREEDCKEIHGQTPNILVFHGQSGAMKCQNVIRWLKMKLLGPHFS